MDKPLNRDELLELKEFLTERMVDNMSTKDLEEYVSNDLFNYFDKLGEHEFLEEARNYWDDSFDEVVEEVRDYMKSVSYTHLTLPTIYSV